MKETTLGISKSYSKMTIIQLKSECKSRGLRGYSNQRKLVLIGRLEAYDLKPVEDVNKNKDNQTFYCVNYEGKTITIHRTQDWFINITSLSKQFGKTWRY